MSFGGDNGPGDSAKTESWNGTNWTEVNVLNTARQELGGAGASNTSALAFSGGPGNKQETEDWNGISWQETADMSNGSPNLAGAGTAANALAFGMGSSSPFNKTEEWNLPSVSTRTIDTD